MLSPLYIPTEAGLKSWCRLQKSYRHKSNDQSKTFLTSVGGGGKLVEANTTRQMRHLNLVPAFLQG